MDWESAFCEPSRVDEEVRPNPGSCEARSSLGHTRATSNHEIMNGLLKDFNVGLMVFS